MIAIAFLGYIRSLKWFKYEKTTTKNTIKTSSLSSKRFYSSLNHFKFITPIKKENLTLNSPISTMDIETMEFDGAHIPIAISTCYLNNGKIENKIFLIQHKLLLINKNKAINNL